MLAQAVVALPLVVYTGVFGFTRYGVVNAVIGVFGDFSLFIALFNLVPVRPLDGAIAWRALPALWRGRGFLRGRAKRPASAPAPRDRPPRTGGWIH